ncbi:hypothetical protein HGH93_13770 [Chitinophaga polysaccharea]|uniref:hypothetical protein n=1 Tax=Chitinophaga polysaccharea TaxID=1293035 RepID=UPI00145558C1|nr:hypothetical protein [Chitinophaga polysaccharea]NLR59178.1 hypothetical protein [Chitinophaga polysaccharea]
MAFQQIQLPVQYEFGHANLRVRGCAIHKDFILLCFKDSPMLARTSPDLQLEWIKDLGVDAGGYVSPRVDISPDGKLFSITQANRLRVFDETGEPQFHFEHPAWEAFNGANGFFTPDNRRLLFMFPGTDCDHLSVLDLNSREVKMTTPVTDHQYCTYTLSAIPGSDKIMLEAAAGQDECRLSLVTLLEDDLLIEGITECQDRVMGTFAPDGKAFVTGPHYEEGIEVFSFPGLVKLNDIPQEDIFRNRDEYVSEEPDSLNYYVFFLGQQHLIALTRFGRLLLINRSSGDCIGELCLEHFSMTAYDDEGEPTTDPDKIVDYSNDLGDMRLVAHDRLLVHHRTGRLYMYSLAPVLTWLQTQ